MAHARWLTAWLVPLAWLAESRAQVLVHPNPYDHGGITVGRGLRFSYHHRLYVRGFIGSSYAAGPYGWRPYAVVNRVTVINPPPQGAAVEPLSPVRERDEYDTTGIDLDEIDPVTMQPRKIEPVRENLPERPPPRPPKRPDRPMPVLPRLKDEPRPQEKISLIEQGRKAFADRAYGLAAQHFRLAAEDKPRDPLPYFLLAQAQFALGKYRDAVLSIQAGMDRRPDWPRAQFPPRQMYRANDVDFLGHLKRLEDVVEARPDDPALLFLLAYELWFDGKQAKARPLFEKAKRLAADPAYINRFLGA